VLGPLRRKRATARLRRGVYLIPSLFTLGNLFGGYACILYAMRRDLETAAPFIAVAILLDMLDGRIARMTGTVSEFGREFDSLADVISFGIAPAIMAYVWGLESLNRLGWAAGFIFVTAAAMRLARFNIQSATASDKRYFAGLPSPAAAAVVAGTIYLYPQGFPGQLGGMIALAVVIVPGLLMVTTVRFRSFKTIDLQARRSYKVLAVLAVVIALIQWHPKVVLVILAYSYLISAFVEWLVQRIRHRGQRAAATPTRKMDN
jgi:CDP-diacylglycerol--serine O-phosphatidyltransferase